MGNRLKKLMFICCLLCPLSLYCQQPVTGVVKDANLNEELIGVSVVIKGTDKGTVTDFEGRFSIEVQQGQTLVFSYIGYLTTETTIGTQKHLNINMTENVKIIDEIVVVGYGVQKKSSSVAAITTTKGDDLLKTGGVTSISEALQGQMPGVVAINTNSKPGANSADLFIRGKGTWGDASPLIMVDGVERSFNDIDMNEIETISVLKDASATAVFGQRGGNGVILLTTKRGMKTKPEVSFNANMGFKQPSVKLDWADYVTSMGMYNEAQINDLQWGKVIPESTMDAWRNAYATGNYGPYNDYFPEIDWWDETVRDVATEQTYNLNARGGTEKMRYFVSLGYLYDGDVYKTEKQPDYDPSFNYRRYNWRFNVDLNITPTTVLTTNLAGKMSYRNQPIFQDWLSDDSYFFPMFLTTPTNSFPIKYSDGHWGDDTTARANLIANMLTGGQANEKTFQGFYDITLKQDLDFLLKGLSFKGTYSYSSYSTTYEQIINNGIYKASSTTGPKNEIRYARLWDYSQPITDTDGNILSYPLKGETRFPLPTSTEGLPSTATYNLFDNYKRDEYFELAFNYSGSFGDHNLTGLLLWSGKNSDFAKRNNGTKMEFPIREMDYVTRITYNWKETYLVEVNGAANGSEGFAPGKKYGFFPSYSVGWRVSEEPWMNWKPLSNLKLRYSYGEVGNSKMPPNTERFGWIQLYETGGNITLGLDQNVNWGPMYWEGQVANSKLIWEVCAKQNLGLEVGLFDKLNMTVDLFAEKRDKILMQRKSIASWFGAGVPTVNYGETKSHGFEFEVSWNDKLNKDFRYFAKFNIASSENRVIFKDDPKNYLDYLKEAGKPIGVSRKYLATGNYTSIDDIFNGPVTSINKTTQGALIPGDLFYMDYNGDGFLTLDDQVPLKELNYPLTTCGMTLGFNYKHFGFNALIYAAPEVYKEQISTLLWDFPGSNVKAQPNTFDRWTPDKVNADGPVRPSVHLANEYNSVGSTFTYTNHAYVRLKNIELNYSIPKTLLKNLYISQCQFYLNGNNLVTFSKSDPRRDPETANASVYPIVRRYNLGMRLTF